MASLFFTAALGPHELLGLLLESTLLGKLVLLLLFILSVLSWAVMIEKGRHLSRIRRGHQEFWRLCGEWRQGKRGKAEMAQWCADRPDLPLANLWRESVGAATPSAVRRITERVAYFEIEGLERYLLILSTTVTISPFLGLMGTVWGIMNAFWNMSAMRSANLTVVAPGIAEALITTIAGLSAAIPAVVFYNMFVRKIDLVGNELDRLRTLMEDAVSHADAGNRRRPARRPDTLDKERIR